LAISNTNYSLPKINSRVINEIQTSETNTLKGTIGALKFVGRINETQILQTKCGNICKL